MTKGQWTNATERDCLVCGEKFVPVRRKQWFCSPPRKCRNTNKAKLIMAELARERGADLNPRPCERCGTVFQPRAIDQVTCGASCPGRPDYTLTCTNPDCPLPGRTFTVKGNSRGKGNQQYCSEKCRDHVARIRQGQRFRRYDGMSREKFIAKGEAQNWQCMICGRTPEPDGRRVIPDELPYLEVDHDHTTGVTRDLLCGDCNKGLGLFQDDIARLLSAAAYLERHQGT